MESWPENGVFEKNGMFEGNKLSGSKVANIY